jgi:uncharacterized damage-inducible protein DinB
MNLSQSLLSEFDQEMAGTRRVLERVPTAKFSWLPHAKSMSFGRLAAHVADLPSRPALILSTDEMDRATRRPNPVTAETTEELLTLFDQSFAAGRAALAAADGALFKTWTFRNGDHVIFTLPKIAALRAFCFSHLIHHRGQLTVYLRLNDLPVPSLYGPSADES